VFGSQNVLFLRKNLRKSSTKSFPH